MLRAVILVVLAFLTIHFTSGRPVRDESDFLSDGMDQRNQSQIMELDVTATTVTCEPIYGFLPCTTVVWGQLFLLVVYEYLLSLAQTYVSSGSDLFFQMVGTGIFGASLFHMLGMVPQVAVVLVSGITGSEETIESIIAMSLGILAGTVIMNLTLIWGLTVSFGSYEISQSSTSSSRKDKKSFSFTGYGVETDKETKDTARLMLVSLIPFLLLLLAKALNSSSAKRIVILISLIISAIFLITYCIYQVFEPWIQERRLDYLLRNYVKKNLVQVLLTDEGTPDEEAITQLFHTIDQDNNSQISVAELRALMLGIQIEEVGLGDEDFVTRVIQVFDNSHDSNISKAEFIQGLSKWLSEANNSVNTRNKTQKKLSNTNSNLKGTSETQQSLLTKSTKTNNTATSQSSWWNYVKATFLVIIGTAISSLLAQPLMETLAELATNISIPSFLVSYFVIPFAINFRTGYNSIVSAREKTESAVSLTLSEIYGGVFVNNVMGLVTLLALIYIRDVLCDISAESLMVLIVCSGVGVTGSFSSKFPVWTTIVAYALYPISLGFLYVLTTVIGWG